MKIKEGKIYRSRNFPNISRKVLMLRYGVVTYEQIDAREIDQRFRPVMKLAESEFIHCSSCEVVEKEETKCEE